MTQIVYNPSDIDFAKPGKHHYQLAFQMDGNWGSSLIPLTVINGLERARREKRCGVWRHPRQRI